MRSDKKDWSTAVTLSWLLHILLCPVIYFALNKEDDSKSDPVVQKSEPEVVFRLQVAPQQPVPLLEEPKLPEPEVTPVKPKVQKPRYTRTDKKQLQGKPEEASMIGEHDTLAQSNTAADVNAPKRPSIAGDDKSGTNDLASSFQEGDLESSQSGSPAKASQATPPTVEIPQPPERTEVAKEAESKPTEVPQQNKEALAASELKEKELMDFNEKLEKPPRSKQPLKLEQQTDEGLAERGDKRHARPDLLESLNPNEATEQQLAKLMNQPRIPTPPMPPRPASSAGAEAGFRPEVKANKSMGSISRRGKVASHDTKSTPTGRYTAKVLKLISQEWYRRCGQHRDLLLPGSLTMRWFVYEDGKVKDISVVSEHLGGDIQKGITLQAISGTKLPVMPKEVLEELKGDPIFIQIDFEF